MYVIKYVVMWYIVLRMEVSGVKFIPSRDLRNNPSKLWKILEDDEIVITSKGKPKAIMIKAGDDVEELLKLIDQTLAQFAVEKMRLGSLESGRSKLSDKEIEEEIRKARRELFALWLKDYWIRLKQEICQPLFSI